MGGRLYSASVHSAGTPCTRHGDDGELPRRNGPRCDPPYGALFRHDYIVMTPKTGDTHDYWLGDE
jgi:hypothetical protein